jgi:hypothetical protein
MTLGILVEVDCETYSSESGIVQKVLINHFLSLDRVTYGVNALSLDLKDPRDRAFHI